MVKIDEPGRRSDCKKKYSPFLPSALFPPVGCRIQCPYSVPFIAMTRDPERFVTIKLILRAKRRWEHGKGTETDGEKEKVVKGGTEKEDKLRLESNLSFCTLFDHRFFFISFTSIYIYVYMYVFRYTQSMTEVFAKYVAQC